MIERGRDRDPDGVLVVVVVATCAAADDNACYLRHESPEALAIAIAVPSCRSSRATKKHAMVSRYSPVALAIAESPPCFMLSLPRSRCCSGRGVSALKLTSKARQF